MKQKAATILIFLVVIFSSFYFGFSRFQNFSGVDEPYWTYGRVPNFWTAVQKHKWKNTNICDKPGVPLAIVSGAGLPFIDGNPKSLKTLAIRSEDAPADPRNPGCLFQACAFPCFLFTLAMLPVFYWLIKKLLGKRTARFSLLFIGLSPILLGISLIINSDAMLWILTALSHFEPFCFSQKQRKKILDPFRIFSRPFGDHQICRQHPFCLFFPGFLFGIYISRSPKRRHWKISETGAWKLYPSFSDGHGDGLCFFSGDLGQVLSPHQCHGRK